MKLVLKFVQNRLLIGLLTLSLASTVLAQTSKRVTPKVGSNVTVSGTVKGSNYVDYLVRVGAGQSVTVTLTSRSTSVNFNFNPPKSNLAMFNGSMGSNKMEARPVPSDGDYIIRVYQMGAAKSEGRTNSFSLRVKVDGRALKPLPASTDAKLRGTLFHARATVPCMVSMDNSITSCEAFVIRRGSNNATVEFRAGRLVRRVLFVKGLPYAHDSSEEFTYSQNGDMFTVRFGSDPSESYTVPEAFLFGG